MTRSDKQSWEQVRAKGKLHFIVSGMVPRGFKFSIPFTLTFVLIDLLAHRAGNPWLEAKQMGVIFLWLTLAAGWGEGAAIWYQRERDYRWLKANAGMKLDHTDP